MTLNLIDPVDARWSRFTALAVGNKPSNVRAEPSVNANIIDALPIGITMTIWHIPPDKLTEVERKEATNEPGPEWYAVKLVDRLGWIRSDVVTLKAIVAPPPAPPPVVVDPVPTKPLPVETPKTPTVAIPLDTALLMREMLGNRSNRLKDDARGQLAEASRIDDILIVLDMLLKVA